ncbi:DNA-binding XRE family transcriptional regulator [Chitinophaga dinghuensis]|uniref:DNA-binding XRE family transcriptional regulator n=1 Tax=Chitinophaga dinghuensis TaxID=1539050 RepID=A0A327VRH1_9BACT|nr:helix-turn-helix transcriptional regulator [Chitinophaga dinghuensis]RAJ76679.1 DNA-binding XRE family transcriptional regulator [Chitinophaga dinghuensis]
MSFGERLGISRKRRDLTQDELGAAIGTTRIMIGKYERDVTAPSIDVAGKMADALNVSLDYLVRNINPESETSSKLSPLLFEKLESLEKLSLKDQEYLMAVIDAFIAKSKLESIMK